MLICSNLLLLVISLISNYTLFWQTNHHDQTWSCIIVVITYYFTMSVMKNLTTVLCDEFCATCDGFFHYRRTSHKKKRRTNNHSLVLCDGFLSDHTKVILQKINRDQAIINNMFFDFGWHSIFISHCMRRLFFGTFLCNGFLCNVQCVFPTSLHVAQKKALHVSCIPIAIGHHGFWKTGGRMLEVVGSYWERDRGGDYWRACIFQTAAINCI